eukprot:TRINITY_DN2644_c0_g1_i2.p1 TRINITY_DN2644_c0_g1~~TRINITY_DN2644_c0_g1_i2.p1  ORF type:complete len:574 (+),score=114.35 TRINITY_DN2644_c0_g1_i2:28-1749(+)
MICLLNEMKTSRCDLATRQSWEDDSEETSSDQDESPGDLVAHGSRRSDRPSGKTTTTLSVKDIEERLQQSQDVLWRLRCRVSGTIFLLAVVLGIACQAFRLSGLLRSSTPYLGAKTSIPALRAIDIMDGISDWGPSLRGLSWFTKVAGLLLLGLAPLADDLWLTRLVLMLQSVIVSIDVPQSFAELLGISQDGHSAHTCHHRGILAPAAYCLSHFYLDWAFCIMDVLFVFCATVAFLRRRPLKAQHCMWCILAAYFWAELFIDLIFVMFTAELLGTWNGPLWLCPGSILGVIVAMLPQSRQALQGRVRRSLEDEQAMSAAAGIASLVGRCEPAEVLQQAACRFRVVPIDSIAEADLADNLPNPMLIRCTQGAKLRHCDAFISHSWHDECALKWAALQDWRSDFLSSEEREAKVWFDKWCIDQKNIKADLQCLPIFLSGCHQLVVLCGKTYLSRLWCIVELFTFVKMGGSAERIHIVPLIRKGHEEEDVEELRRLFKDFDARRCQCHDGKDKEDLLVIINTAFGSLETFNEAARAILDRAVFVKACDSQLEEARRSSTITLRALPDSEQDTDEG